MTQPPTVYDAVPYHTVARPATHIDRIACLGRLVSLPCAHPNAARVLELGCGNGGNLIPMALSLPGSEFVGIDLAATAVARASAAAAELGLSNIAFATGDISKLGAEIGEFDYVIAHGVYSWVPADVRQALLRLLRERLRPAGIAFVSYNALPGDHIRSVVRQMMRMHTAGIAEPTRKLQQARALLQMLANAPGAAGDVYRPLLKSEVGRALQSSDDLLFHDDLAEISQPFFFTEFMGSANANELQFLAEVPFHSMSLATLPSDMSKLLAELGAHDIVAKEQYLDFLTCRGFRQTLLCHKDAALQRDIDTERMAQFRFTTDADREIDPDAKPGVVSFRHRNGSAMSTDSSCAIAAFEAMIAARPRSLGFDDLARLAGATDDEAREELAATLYQTFSVGVIELRLNEPELVTTVSEHPRASAWAAREAPSGRACNLYHELIDLSPAAVALLPLADGTRTVPELAADAQLSESDVTKTMSELAALALLAG